MSLYSSAQSWSHFRVFYGLCPVLFRALPLQTLDVRGNRWGAPGAASVVSALSKNSTLTSLDMSEASVTDKGCQAIVEFLKEDTTLIELRYSCVGGSMLGFAGSQPSCSHSVVAACFRGCEVSQLLHGMLLRWGVAVMSTSDRY